MEREIVNNLRDEYFKLLPDIRKILEEMEARISYALISIKKSLKNHEQIEIQSRVKDCESAIGALIRREEGRKSLPKQLKQYSLLRLKDLAGVRVLVFPRRLMKEADEQISKFFPDWNFDPIYRGKPSEEILANKYFGYIDPKKKVYGEYQIMPMLIGLFWQIEHAVLYKPSTSLKGIERDFGISEKKEDIFEAFDEFEKVFETIIDESIKDGYYKV